MDISIEDVDKAFTQLIEGKITRDEADRWAYGLMQSLENGKLQFHPPTNKVKIWNAVMFLYGIDLKGDADEYLHSIDDIRDAQEKYITS